MFKKLKRINNELTNLITNIEEYSSDSSELNKKDESNHGENEDDLKYNNISISLDSLDEIFDDFDDNPEVYEARTLSDDFLDAIKLRYKFSLNKLRIILLVPFSKEVIGKEETIICRIKEQLRDKKKDIKNQMIRNFFMSMIYFGIGIFTLLNINTIKTMIELIIRDSSELINEIPVIIGWVGIWEGITHIIDFNSGNSKNTSFLHKIEKAEYEIKYYT